MIWVQYGDNYIKVPEMRRFITEEHPGHNINIVNTVSLPFVNAWFTSHNMQLTNFYSITL